MCQTTNQLSTLMMNPPSCSILGYLKAIRFLEGDSLDMPESVQFLRVLRFEITLAFAWHVILHPSSSMPSVQHLHPVFSDQLQLPAPHLRGPMQPPLSQSVILDSSSGLNRSTNTGDGAAKNGGQNWVPQQLDG